MMAVTTGEPSGPLGPADTCYNACASINPSDPVKVAENMKELVEAAEEVRRLRNFAANNPGHGDAAYARLEKAEDRLFAALSSIGVE